MYTCGFHVYSYRPLWNTIARLSQPARGNPRTPRDPTWLLFMYMCDDVEWLRDCVAAVLYFLLIKHLKLNIRCKALQNIS